ncbi:hypothetical protein C8F01DRAFT_1184031 [Mycena amicta]|nr:hypothetical protein C8F01DRAFT_1184031 [Mycena amicta]
MPRPSFATSLFVAGCTLLAGSLQVRACSGASDAKPLYRNYRAAGTDHFYTGIRALVFTTQVPGSVRFHRLWSASAGAFCFLLANVPFYRSFAGGNASDHFYTVSVAERDGAVGSGWKYEKIAGYVFPPDANTGSTTTTTKGYYADHADDNRDGTALADSNAGSGSGGGGSNAGVASSSSLSIERVVGMCGLLMVGLVRLF